MPQPSQIHSQFEDEGSHTKRAWTQPRLINLSSARAAQAKIPTTTEAGPFPKPLTGAETTFSVGPGSASFGPS
jgi:hypothetical protein